MIGLLVMRWDVTGEVLKYVVAYSKLTKRHEIFARDIVRAFKNPMTTNGISNSPAFLFNASAIIARTIPQQHSNL